MGSNFGVEFEDRIFWVEIKQKFEVEIWSRSKCLRLRFGGRICGVDIEQGSNSVQVQFRFRKSQS